MREDTSMRIRDGVELLLPAADKMEPVKAEEAEVYRKIAKIPDENNVFDSMLQELTDLNRAIFHLTSEVEATKFAIIKLTEEQRASTDGLGHTNALMWVLIVIGIATVVAQYVLS